MKYAVLSLLLLCSFAFTASAQEAKPLTDDPELEKRLANLAGELRCLVCQNETLADSQADLAQDLRAQIREQLEADLRNSIISQDQYDQDRDDIKRRLLEDVSSAQQPQQTNKQPSERGTAYAIAIALPLLAIVLYAKFGNINERPAETEAPPA